MPANRLRNLDWQKSLRQVWERGGSLDVTIATEDRIRTEAAVAANVLWRVRLLEVSDDEIVIEEPTTLGKPIDFEDDIELVAIMTIGQNRWIFRAKKVGKVRLDVGGGRFGSKPTTGLRLSMPEHAERCQRRASYRVSTATLHLPEVDVWPLLDPSSVVLAERANVLASKGARETDAPQEIQLPDVGPRFSAKLLNLGGGGVGLSVAADQGQSLLRHKIFWLRISLPGVLEAPICATTKVVHTHMTAMQDYYAGMAFDFTFNPAHQDHVVNQIGKYVASVQRSQMLRKSA